MTLSSCWTGPIHQIPDESLKLSYRLKWFPVCASSDFQSISWRQEAWLPWIAVDQLKDAELLEEKPPPRSLLDKNGLFFWWSGWSGQWQLCKDVTGGHWPDVRTLEAMNNWWGQESPPEYYRGENEFLWFCYWSYKTVKTELFLAGRLSVCRYWQFSLLRQVEKCFYASVVAAADFMF